MTEQEIKNIRNKLEVVAIELDRVSRITKPWRTSKFLNMLQKEINQAQIELCVLLGIVEAKTLESTIFVKTPSYYIIKAMAHDKELKILCVDSIGDNKNE